MAEFVNPFSGVVPGRKLTPREVSRAIRLALAAEEEAVHLYDALADATDNAVAKAVLQDIADEERVHAGEFLRLLSLLQPSEGQFLAQGAGEVDALAKSVAGTAEGGAPSIPMVGDLRKQTT